MDFYVKRNLKKCAGFCFMFFITGIVLFITASANVFGYKWAFQIAAVIFFTSGILLTARYILRDYLISVTGTDRYNLDLVITEIRNRRKTVVCRISAESIKSFEVVLANDKIRRKKRACKYAYNYCGEFFADKYMYVYAVDAGQDIRIKISYSAEFHDLLRKYKSEAR